MTKSGKERKRDRFASLCRLGLSIWYKESKKKGHKDRDKRQNDKVRDRDNSEIEKEKEREREREMHHCGAGV